MLPHNVRQLCGNVQSNEGEKEIQSVRVYSVFSMKTHNTGINFHGIYQISFDAKRKYFNISWNKASNACQCMCACIREAEWWWLSGVSEFYGCWCALDRLSVWFFFRIFCRVHIERSVFASRSIFLIKIMIFMLDSPLKMLICCKMLSKKIRSTNEQKKTVLLCKRDKNRRTPTFQ